MGAKIVRLSEVWTMLDACAPGYTRRETDHFHQVSYRGKTYRALPLGKHGARHNPEIEAGHVRALVRHLEILDCAKRELPRIFAG